jgi:hypothetical protein
MRPNAMLPAEPIAIGLVFLWICLVVSFGLALTPNLEIDLVLVCLIPVGFIGAAGMSGRGRRWWWLYGAIAFLILFPTSAIAGWLQQTAYPPSAFGRLPFTAGAGYRWEMFVFLVGIALAALIALRMATRAAGLLRAALAALIAVGYLIVWDGPLATARAWEVMLAITLVLAAIGLGDVIAEVASNSGFEARVATGATFVICLTLLLLVAGVTWRVLLGDSYFGSFSEPDNDILPLATIAAVLLGALVLSSTAATMARRRATSA